MLNFRENLIDMLSAESLTWDGRYIYYKTLPDCKAHQIKIIETDEFEVILHHKGINNNICADFISDFLVYCFYTFDWS